MTMPSGQVERYGIESLTLDGLMKRVKSGSAFGGSVVSDLIKAIAKLQAQYNLEREDRKHYQEKCETYETRIVQNDIDLGAYHKEVEALTGQLAKLQAERDAFNDKLAMAIDATATFAEKCEKLEAERDKLDEECNNLAERDIERDGQMLRLEAELAAAREQLVDSDK